MFHQAVEFVQRLEWPNSLQECKFNTALSKVIGVALEQYTMELEDMISADIFPRTYREDETNANANFLDRARYQLIGNRGHSGKGGDDQYDFLAQVKFQRIDGKQQQV